MKENTGKNKLGIFVIFTLVIIITFVAAFVFMTIKISVYEISGTSMNDTLVAQEKTLLYKTNKVTYNDIIVFSYYDNNYKTDLIKRVIGLPGDLIETKYDSNDDCYHIYRNGKLVDEKNIKEKMSSIGKYEQTSITVPKNRLYVLGDNRNNSKDSHEGILATFDNVQGKVFFNLTKFKFI